MFRMAACCLLALMLSGCAEAEKEPIGLVLSGGGAKGAYEVGVWKELQAAGLAPRVKAISGTSVGAINAALFATRPSAADALWLDHIKDVFTLNTNRVGQSIQKTLDSISEAKKVADKTGEDWKGVVRFLIDVGLRIGSNAVEVAETGSRREGYLASSRLESALTATLPRDWPKTAPIVYATALENGVWKVARWRLNDETPERRILMIRASAAFPVGFDTVDIDGKTYVDGGWEKYDGDNSALRLIFSEWKEKGGDNTPIGPILENHPDIKTVIVVYLKDEKDLSEVARNRIRDKAKEKGVRLVEIVPSENIGGMFWGMQGVFDASTKKVRDLIRLGRKDARNVLEKEGLAARGAGSRNPLSSDAR